MPSKPGTHSMPVYLLEAS